MNHPEPLHVEWLQHRRDSLEYRIAELEAERDRLYDSHVQANAESLAKTVRIAALEARVAELRKAAEKVIQTRYRYGWSPEADSVIWDLGAHVPGWDAAIAASGEGK